MKNIEEKSIQDLLQELIELTNNLSMQNRNSIFNLDWKNSTPSTIITKREVELAADYIEQNMPKVTHFTSGMKDLLWNFVPTKTTLDGHIAEFGVWKGESINYLAQLFHPKTIFGFDSFKGLEEDYSFDYSKGGFNQNGVSPLVQENVKLVIGSFSNTLPTWLKENPGIFSFINIDCDTYESTKTILNLLGPERITSGTVILFDEYFGFPGWKHHEFKAWQSYCNENNVNYNYIAVCGYQVLIKVL